MKARTVFPAVGIVVLIGAILLAPRIEVTIEPQVAEAQALTPKVETVLRQFMGANPDGALAALKVAVTGEVDGPTARAILKAWTAGLSIQDFDDITDDRVDTFVRRLEAGIADVDLWTNPVELLAALKKVITDNDGNLKQPTDDE